MKWTGGRVFADPNRATIISVSNSIKFLLQAELMGRQPIRKLKCYSNIIPAYPNAPKKILYSSESRLERTEREKVSFYLNTVNVHTPVYSVHLRIKIIKKKHKRLRRWDFKGVFIQTFTSCASFAVATQ